MFSACQPVWLVVWLAACLSACAHACPKKCFCNEFNKMGYCSRRGLTSIPSGIPLNFLQLNFNGNIFQNSALQRSNFSRFTALEHLYLSECGIERLEHDTFSDLTRLQWLDLSSNRIKVLPAFSFRGLSLMHLFLNGNRNVQINPRAFEGLATTGLYLHDCSLRRLDPDVLGPLNSTLRYLWLNGNELELIDKRLSPMFSSLSHLRLGSNPLHCNCQVLWLKEFFDGHAETFEGASPPSCLTPSKLKGRYFNDLTLSDFRCQAPVFKNIDAVFRSREGRLRCTASGDPAPTLYWIQPSGHSSRYNPPRDEEARKNEGVLVVRAKEMPRHDMTGQYFCVAINDAGNVTLTLNASWPQVTEVIYRPAPPSSVVPSSSSSSTPSSSSLYPDVPTSTPLPARPEEIDGYVNDDEEKEISWAGDVPILRPVNDHHEDFEVEAARPGSSPSPNKETLKDENVNKALYNFTAHNMRRSGERSFNLTELIGAVIGTHVCTLLLCLIFLPLYYKRRWRNQQRQEDSPRHPQKPPPNETLFLNGLGHHHTYRDFLDTPPPKR